MSDDALSTRGGFGEHARLLRKLEAARALPSRAREEVGRLSMRVRAVPPDTDVAHQGDSPSECCLLLEGWACRYKILGRGQRQILSFHVPGDLLDLHAIELGVLDYSVGVISAARVAYIPYREIKALMESEPRLTAAFWRDTLIDGAIFREWLSGVGRRSAHERIAHLLCEMYVKVDAVGLTSDDGFDFPVTQAEIGDALGLSTVHVNRSLQELRRQGLIISRGSRLEIPDFEALKAAGDFNPMYLHVQPRGQAA